MKVNLRALWLLGYALAFLCSWLIVAPAYGQTVTVTPDTWDLYRGIRIVSRDHATEAACTAAAGTQSIGTYTCRTQTRVEVTSAPAPVDCDVSDWSDWAGGEWSACTNGTQTRQETHTRTIVTQPANGGAACPALSETRTATQACTVEPPPTADWVHCANQEETLCTGATTIGAYTGTRRVRFGVNESWVEREMTSGVRCNSTIFGMNPARGLMKVCQVHGSTTPPPTEPPPPPPVTGSATLNWTPPATMSDGTPATLAGFRIRYGRSADTLTLQREVADARATSAVVNELASGTWYFALTAYDTQGRESLPSNTASKAIQ